MRLGSNAAKGRALSAYGGHRVIVPLHVPEAAGYYAESLEVFQLSLRSLRATDTSGAAVTVVANGCCNPVLAELRAQLAAGAIDQLVVNRENRGKIDALIAGARGSYEPFVTFTDADILFRPGWCEAVFALLRVFPECAAASPFPALMAQRHLASATWLGAWLRRELVEGAHCDPADLRAFAASVGNPGGVFSPVDYRTQLCVRRGGVDACVGTTHAVFTVRREAFLRGVPPQPVCRALGNFHNMSHLDRPPDLCGYWRLSTPRAFVWHMGNRPEAWMREHVAALPVPSGPGAPGLELPAARARGRHWSRLLPFTLRHRLAARYWSQRERRLTASAA